MLLRYVKVQLVVRNQLRGLDGGNLVIENLYPVASVCHPGYFDDAQLVGALSIRFRTELSKAFLFGQYFAVGYNVHRLRLTISNGGAESIDQIRQITRWSPRNPNLHSTNSSCFAVANPFEGVPR